MSDFSPLGDAAPGQILYAYFNTRDNTGAGSALSSGSVRAYKNGSTAESTAGLTLTTDFDGLTGLNLIAIDTSADGTFYAAGNDFAIVWAGTVNGIASTGNAAAAFSLSNRSVRDSSGVTTLLSRLSAARAGYLDNLSAGAVALESSLQALITTIGVSAAGVATAVWANGTRTLSSFGTLVSDIWSNATRLLTAGTNIVLAKGTGITGFNDLSAAQVNAEADTAIADAGLSTASALATVATYVDTEVAAIKAKTDLIPAAPAAVGDIPSAASIATATAAQVTTDHGAGSYIRNTEPLDAAGVRSAVGLASANLDTQIDALPTNAEFSTALGTADDAVLAAIAALNNLNAAGVRAAIGMSSANLDTQLSALAAYVDTEVAAILTAAGLIKAQTDKLTFDGSNRVEANATAVNDVALTGVGTSGDPWGPA